MVRNAAFWDGDPLGSEDLFGPHPRGRSAMPPLDLVEIAGEIKWFDVSKGYGFIVPDNGLPDVLLHVTTLRRDGFQTAREGARVVCEALQRAKGLQVFRVLSLDLSTAIHPPQTPPARTHIQVVPDRRVRDRRRQVVQPGARLRLPVARRGHRGHLRPHGDLAPVRHHRTEAGRHVLVRFGDGPKGLMAAEIRPLKPPCPRPIEGAIRPTPPERLRRPARPGPPRDRSMLKTLAARRGLAALILAVMAAGLPALAAPAAGPAVDDLRSRPRAATTTSRSRSCDRATSLSGGSCSGGRWRPTTACSSTSAPAARHHVDEEHLSAARHGVHRARTAGWSRSSRMPSRCRRGSIYSGGDALGVLELNAGAAARIGVMPGDGFADPMFKR